MSDIPRLYAAVDCFVLPTRGEGWGLPIFEAMAMGLPVIATNWSGQVDFMNENNAFPIRVDKLVPSWGSDFLTEQVLDASFICFSSSCPFRYLKLATAQFSSSPEAALAKA
jgi:glycosyltransferase involved in cell wall biosynthesis